MIWRHRAVRAWERFVEWAEEGVEWTYSPPGDLDRFFRLAVFILAAEGLVSLGITGAFQIL